MIKQKQNRLATAIKRATVCAATAALLASAGAANALEMKIGGYIKTDVTYDLDQDLGPSVGANTVNTGAGAPSDPSFRIHSLQSRINFSATEGDLKVYLEGDFFGGGSSELVSNSRHFRLRHAYGKWGDLLIGQTWSTFMDANWVLYPSTVDFAGPAGATFIRQSILRWTVSDGLDFALENPENRVTDRIDPADPKKDVNRGRDTIPDIILRYASSGDVSWQVAGLFQQFEADGSAADGESETNIGLTGGVAFKTGSGSVSAKFNANSNRYTYYGFGNPAAVVVGNTIELIDHTSIVLAWNHNYGGADNAKTTVAFGQVSFDDEFLRPTDIDTVSTIHVNYRWSPRDNVNLGVEVITADREDVNGDSGDATRIQFGAQFTF
ncbi:MAG: hypothetical protein IIC58_13905 [Proteobacteria bacterium]|nr:hypothetical protein [Pseudomonadota bacterium]